MDAIGQVNRIANFELGGFGQRLGGRIIYLEAVAAEVMIVDAGPNWFAVRGGGSMIVGVGFTLAGRASPTIWCKKETCR